MSSSHYTQAFGPAKVSARSSYPTFLSLQDSIILQLKWAWRGLYDSFRWGAFIITVARWTWLLSWKYGLLAAIQIIDTHSVMLRYGPMYTNLFCLIRFLWSRFTCSTSSSILSSKTARYGTIVVSVGFIRFYGSFLSLVLLFILMWVPFSFHLRNNPMSFSLSFLFFSRQHGARLLLNAHTYFSMVVGQHLFLRLPIPAFWLLSQRQRIDWWWRLHLCSFLLG